jgi:hypothetical protein
VCDVVMIDTLETSISTTRDPTEKDFNISARLSISKEKLKTELNKCIVLCKICHGELHAELW